MRSGRGVWDYFLVGTNSAFKILETKQYFLHNYEVILEELARLTKRWQLLSMFIQMHDAPDYLHLEPAGFYHNCYNQQGLEKYLLSYGSKGPEILFQQADDELLLFTRSEVI